jgi:hypothetical protein
MDNNKVGCINQPLKDYESEKLIIDIRFKKWNVRVLG